MVANAAIVPAGANGAIQIYASDATDVVVDLYGVFGWDEFEIFPKFYPVVPCRIADTRAESGFPAGFGSPRLEASQPRVFALRNSGCNVPRDAQAVSLNATVAPIGRLDYLTLYPGTGAPPVVSTLNAMEGQVIANAAILSSPSGRISATAFNPTHLILDLNGYFAP